MARNRSSLRLGVIDGDAGFLLALRKRLEAAGWEQLSLSATQPVDGLVELKLNALLLDPSAVEGDGTEFLRRVCDLLPGLPVLICAAGSTLAERVRALRLGADDWIGKPSHPEEVVARVEAAVRRAQRGPSRLESSPVTAGELEIRPDRFQVLVGGGSIGLTRREFEVLHLLAESRGQVIERDALYQRVWGYAMAHGDRSVDVYVRKLRHKLERCSPGWRYIHTHVGVGYRFDAEPVDGPADRLDDVASQPLHTAATAA